MQPITLTLDGDDYTPGTSREVRERLLAHLAARQFAEVWLRSGDEYQISMLVNGQRAWLMYLVNLDQECWHTLAPKESANDGTVEFKLANGQVDDYAAGWTIGTREALAGLEHFFDTRQRLPSLRWERDF